MSEEKPTPIEDGDQPKPQPPTDPPAETVEDLKAKLAKYKEIASTQEKRAKENAQAAAELEKIKEAQKTEAEKAADRLRQLESEANQARQEATRFKIAAKFKIADDYADFLTGDEESMTAQAKKLSKLAEDAGKPRAPKPDPNQGRAASSGTSTADQFAAAFNEAFNR